MQGWGCCPKLGFILELLAFEASLGECQGSTDKGARDITLIKRQTINRLQLRLNFLHVSDNLRLFTR